MRATLLRTLKYLEPFFNTRAAGMYILLFAAAIGVGTFVENDFGTSSAQHVIYKSTWFSVLLALFCITIAVNSTAGGSLSAAISLTWVEKSASARLYA